MRPLREYSKDYYGGALMVLIGLAACLAALRYRVGTLADTGPGFFPAAVGVALALVGVAIALGARTGPEAQTPRSPDWRGWACIVGGVAAFIALGAYGGLAPATFALVFISALGDRRNSGAEAFWLALVMVVIAALVFRLALQLELPLFAWG